MRIRAWLPLSALSACVFWSCSEPEGPPFQTTADTKELMVAMVDPAADVLWDSVGTVITAEGVDEWHPRTDEEWAEVRNSVLVLMEAGNLLMMGDRARDTGAWMELSRGMIDAGAEALEAVEAKDPDAVFAVGETVYFACDRCHALYWIDDRDRGRIRETPRTRNE